MATAEPAASLSTAAPARPHELADQWRLLTRAATFVALLTSPALFVWFHQREGWSVLQSLGATLCECAKCVVTEPRCRVAQQPPVEELDVRGRPGVGGEPLDQRRRWVSPGP